MANDAKAPMPTVAERIAARFPGGSVERLFGGLLYGGAEADTLAGMPDERLAAYVSEALAMLAERQRGRHRVRVRWGGLGTSPIAGREPVVLEIANDDMPFLLDSILGEVRAQGYSPRLVLHPIYKCHRTSAGELKAVLGPGDRNWGDGRQESFIAIHFDRLGAEEAGRLAEAISQILEEVRAVVAGWRPMVGELERAIAMLRTTEARLDPKLRAESIAFLQWLAEGQFTLLGTRELRLEGDAATGDLVSIDGSGRGILTDPTVMVLRRGSELVQMTPEIRRFFFDAAPLIVTKANVISRVHRRVHMDYVGVKMFDEKGAIAGELRVVGLFTSQAYTQSPRLIPLLRLKVERVVAGAGLPPESHDGKALINVLESYPRDELFQIGERELLRVARGILDLDVRPRVRVFARVDRFDRFVSVLVFGPRDRFNTGVRERVGKRLAEAWNGRIAAFYPHFTDGPLVRIQFIVGRYEGTTPVVDEARLEAEVAEVFATFEDRLAEALAHRPDGDPLGQRYLAAFPPGYAAAFPVERAIEDIARLERLGPDRPLTIDFYAAKGTGVLRAAIYRLDEQPIPLSDRVPVLENLGFSVIDERSYRLTPRFPDGERPVVLHDMALTMADGLASQLAGRDGDLEETFLAIFRGDADNDSYNRLVLAAGATWREAALLRALGAYLRQIGLPFGPRYIAETLVKHAGVARELIALFKARFDPDAFVGMLARKAEEAAIRARLEAQLATIPSLEEDRILRHVLSLVAATLRTNVFQTDANGQPPETIALKLRSKLVDGAPDPKPFAEIFVYSPRVEGVHLRFAPIARGGIRWSDRAQDYRTEVLGLAKAQQVKNVVIVPAGAKGGFVPKRLSRMTSREDMQKEGVASYRIFVSALLDITDNIVDGTIVHPPRVVRHDDPDPYLVVAADKGTATFSNFANEISAARGFWLGDAFASGGSLGYDHKGMGITARGGWECVKRHFREMNRDIQKEPFTAVGVGDMSGDVFGNAMLLSRTTRLVAAFDHRDIFLDPAPDPETSWRERKRLFEKPRSSWQDYDKALISKGGGIFSRAAKSIPISAAVKSTLGVTADAMTPTELMRAILQAEVDLLWFGGIGTYVKAATETDEAVADRANDPIRINGADVRAKVIGEGANLGMTQRGRIEYAAAGGRVDTDFIDNSAGVNTSDQEVNIKIALAPAVAAGRLPAEERKTLLAAMTDEVAAAVLRNNYLQSLALSLAERRLDNDLGFQRRLMQQLVREGTLDRRLENLPSDMELAERLKSGRTLTRPELCILLSYSKIALSRDLIETPIADDPYFVDRLVQYFPATMRERFRGDILEHRLKREIIVTDLTNTVVNRGGSAFVVRLEEETGRGPADIVRAFVAAESIYALAPLSARIDALDGRIEGTTQLDLYLAVQALLRDRVLWLLRHARLEDGLSVVIARFRPIAEEMRRLGAAVAGPERGARMAETAERLKAQKVPDDLAAEMAALPLVAEATDIARVAEAARTPAARAAESFHAVGAYLRLDEIRARAEALKVSDTFDRLAIAAAIGTLGSAQRTLAGEALGTPGGDVASWLAGPGQRLARAKGSIDEILAGGDLTASRLTVAAAQVRDLAGA